ncbi:hypothetical protein DFH27DRAFT_476242 [Peziza echinospora]|nr:hypothetical protein DFH27DRAFT_476242 [Peziza echinospora]
MLREWFPSAEFPLICSAPMRGISGVKLAAEVSKAGGVGFLGAGYEIQNLEAELKAGQLELGEDRENIAVGFIQWACPLDTTLIPSLKPHPPSAIWLFAPLPPSISSTTNSTNLLHPHLLQWIEALPYPRPPILYQTSSIDDARAALLLPEPNNIDILVVQAPTDAGGHGLRDPSSASLMVLIPEMVDMIDSLDLNRPVPVLAAGGISDARGVAAAVALGAHGAVMGTRFIASSESLAREGYKKLVVDTTDGGRNTVQTRVYDILRGTNGWPEGYAGRGIVNESYREWVEGEKVGGETGYQYDIREKYKAAESAGDFQRLTAYAGTGVGLVNEVIPAGEIVRQAREGARKILGRFEQSSW